MEVDDKSPWFINHMTGDKIYVFADTPHMVKLARNQLFDQSFHLNPQDPPASRKTASKEPLELLLQIDQLNELSPHCLTEKHLSCKGCERQRVFLATQVLSNKTARALRKASELNLIHSPYTEVQFFFPFQ